MVGGRGLKHRRKGLWIIWDSERAIVPSKPGNAGGGKGPCFCNV